MIRYNITSRRSSDNSRPTRLRASLAGSIALHATLAVLLTWLAIRTPPPSLPEPETVTLVFAPAPSEPAMELQSPPSPAAPSAVPVPPTPDVPPVPAAEPAQPPPEPPPPEPTAEPQSPPPPPPPDSLPQEPPLPEPPPAPAVIPPLKSPNPVPRPPSRQVAQPHPSTAEHAAAAPAEAPSPPGPSPAIPTNPPPRIPVSPGWQSALGAWLQAHKTYPDEARRRGDEGRATVRFTVSRDGQVIDFQLVSSTGSNILDAAVERLLRGAKLPPFPPRMDQPQVTVTLQIRYAFEH